MNYKITHVVYEHEYMNTHFESSNIGCTYNCYPCKKHVDVK